MRRRGNSRGTRFCDIVLFVVVLALVLVNIFITMTYFFREASKHEASQPSEISTGDDPSTPQMRLSAGNAEAAVAGGAALDDDPAAVPQVYNYSRHSYPFGDIDSMIAKLIPVKYWGPLNVTKDTEGRLVTDSASFSGHDDEDWKGAYARHDALVRQTGCDLLTIPFNVARDAKCIATLTDAHRWLALKPLAMGFDQRTIKFEVEFLPVVLPDGTNVSMLGSILKVPQKLFPNEAFSEVASFHADRIMHVNRIPPTAWVCIPVGMIRDSVARYGGTVETVDEFLQESKAHNYSEWVEKDLFEYVQRSHGYEEHPVTREPCIGASIQLRVADVAHLLDSVLKIPYVPHNESWFRFLDLAHHHDDGDHPLFYKERFASSIIHISELNTFDYVVGNGDRSPNKNNFVVGGCIRRKDCGNVNRDRYYLRHPGSPTFVHLDQGMGFYSSPRRNPIAEAVSRHKKDSDEEDSFCLFRTPLINRLVFLHEIVEGEGRNAVSRFERLMTRRMPKGVSASVTPHLLKQCHDRMTKLLNLVDRCNRLSNARIRRYVMAP